MILARVRRTLVERGLVERGMRVLAACSGGPDSAAMLFALARLGPELGFELEAASVDHGLRAESALDVDVARLQAETAGVPFHALRIDVARDSASLQAAARRARYAALSELAVRRAAARIAVGHTGDDQAETVVMRLLRGSGVAGLSGIAPRRDDGVIRPLIDCRRADVARFASERCAHIARDPSNHDRRFERVRVRTDILPQLTTEDSAVVEHLCDLADEARELAAHVRAEAEALLERSEQGPGSIDVSHWGSERVTVRRWALRAWLERICGEALGREPLRGAERALFSPAEVWLPGGRVLRSAGDGRLVLAAADPKQSRAPKAR